MPDDVVDIFGARTLPLSAIGCEAVSVQGIQKDGGFDTHPLGVAVRDKYSALVTLFSD